MADISIEADTSKVDAFLDVFPKQTGIALLRALNRGTKSAATHANRVVAKDIGIKVGDARKRIRVKPPNGQTLEGELRASLERIPLIELKKRGQRRVPHSFTATMPGGHVGIFKRVRGSMHRGPKLHELPIRELKGPSVGRVVDKHAREITAKSEAEFVKEFDRLLDRIIGGRVA